MFILEKVIDDSTIRGKECSKCKTWRNQDEFNKSKSGDLEGRKHRCRECEAEDRKKAKEKRRKR